MNNTNNNGTASHQPKFAGWTSSPDGRGSLDILWSCLVTLVLCSWSAVCINIPAYTDSDWKKIQRKAWLTLICLIGPEYMLVIALGQWYAAKQSIKEFHADGLTRWTMKHAFYAEMGGFVVETTDGLKFPLRCSSLRYLIDRGLICDDVVQGKVLLETRTIDDRNKIDKPFRVVTLIQALWFCINTLARLAQSLHVTTLELTVLGFFVPTATTYFLWWEKPCDVETTELVQVNATTDQLCLPNAPWHRTPLDWIEREEWHASTLFRYWLTLSRKATFTSVAKARPVKRRSDNDLLPQSTIYKFFLELLPTLPFFAVNFVAWNYDFPTIIERTLWRIASISTVVVLMGGALWYLITNAIWPPAVERLQMVERRTDLATLESQTASGKALSSSNTRWKLRLKRALLKIRNNSPDDDPSLDVPLKMIIPGTVCVIIYAIGRVYILVEDFIAFRRLPSDAFATVDWLSFWPHFG